MAEAEGVELLMSVEELNKQFADTVRQKVREDPEAHLDEDVDAYLEHAQAIQHAFSAASHRADDANADTEANADESEVHPATNGNSARGGIGTEDSAKEFSSEDAHGGDSPITEVESGQAKLYLLTSENSWDTHGMGTYHVNQLNDGGTSLEWKNQALKTILSARLYPGLRLKQNKAMLLMPLFNAASGDSGSSPRSTMLRVKSEDEATRLKDLIEHKIPNS